MLYLELVPVLSYTDFSPFNERYKPIFWQPLIRNEQQKLLFGSKHNRETKKDNQQAPKTLVWGFYLDLCNCPTLNKHEGILLKRDSVPEWNKHKLCSDAA